MCGRFALSTSIERLAIVFDAEPPEDPVEASWNVAPSQGSPVVLGRPAAAVEAAGDEVPGSARRMEVLQWGLIPSWNKDPKGGRRPINARLETVAERPTFRGPLSKRRCLVPVDGWYEWLAGEDGKRPHLTRRVDGEPLALAGLWDRWLDAEGHLRVTFTVMTQDAREDIGWLHHRMPVLMAPERWDDWLDPSLPGKTLVGDLAAPWDVPLETLEVSRAVNNPRNNGPELIEALG